MISILVQKLKTYTAALHGKVITQTMNKDGGHVLLVRVCYTVHHTTWMTEDSSKVKRVYDQG